MPNNQLQGELKTYLHESDRDGKFEEFYIDRYSDLIVLAPHGGCVEPNTDFQALSLANKLGSAAWGTRGMVDGSFNEAFSKWHTSSEDDFKSQSQFFDDIRKRRVGVSFHTMSDEGIVIGGRCSDPVANIVYTSLIENFAKEKVRKAENGDVAGKNPENFVNSASDESIHIEQGISICMEQPVQVIKSIEEAVYSILEAIIV